MAFNFFSGYKNLNFQGGIVTSTLIKGIQKANRKKAAQKIIRERKASVYTGRSNEYRKSEE